eukprot:1781327-Rhodomonas_salina.1
MSWVMSVDVCLSVSVPYTSLALLTLILPWAGRYRPPLLRTRTISTLPPLKLSDPTSHPKPR